MNPTTSHDIKHRKEAKDVFYTPLSVVKKHIESLDARPTDKWFDPFAGQHIYFNNFPTESNRVAVLLHYSSSLVDGEGKSCEKRC